MVHVLGFKAASMDENENEQNKNEQINTLPMG